MDNYQIRDMIRSILCNNGADDRIIMGIHIVGDDLQVIVDPAHPLTPELQDTLAQEIYERATLNADFV